MIQGTYPYKGIHSVVKNVLAGHMGTFVPNSMVINLKTSGTKLFGTG